MRIVSLRWALVAILAIAGRSIPAQQLGPPLAELRVAAEAGDAAAQDKLGDVFRLRSNFEDAVTWYRRAAPKGVLNSQYQLAHILFMWANSPVVPKPTSAMHADEAIPWLLKAASGGHNRARLELGEFYRDGKYVQKDLPEAYKWFCIVSDAFLLDGDAIFAKSSRDSLILKMTLDQIAEGNRRVSAFRKNTGKPIELPEPLYLQHLKLQGITGTPGHSLAIINGKTFAPNDAATLKVDSHSVTIRCLSISSNSATITINGSIASKQLFIH